MSLETISQEKSEREKKIKEGQDALPLDKQIEILREYIQNPDKREEIKKRWEFKRAYDIFRSLPNETYRKIFYGEEGRDIVEEFPKLLNSFIFK